MYNFIKMKMKRGNAVWYNILLHCNVCTVSHKSEYTPHISAINLAYIFKGQYYRNETWIYFRVVDVQLV